MVDYMNLSDNEATILRDAEARYKEEIEQLEQRNAALVAMLKEAREALLIIIRLHNDTPDMSDIDEAARVINEIDKLLKEKRNERNY